MAAFADSSSTVAATAKRLIDCGLSQGSVSQATSAIVTTHDNAIRFWLSGTIPTASTGHVLAAEQSMLIESGDLGNLRMIAETGTAGLSITLCQ